MAMMATPKKDDGDDAGSPDNRFWCMMAMMADDG